MPKLEPLPSGYYLWKYVPSIAAAVIFLILFLAITAVHFWKIWKTKVRFTLPFAIGGLFEVIGYIGRADAYNDTGSLIPYCIQSVFLLLPPTLFAASVYMVLGRIMRAVNGTHHSLIPIKWLTKTFVISDVITFWIQGGGAGMMVSHSLQSTGQAIVTTGLVLQVLSFGLFLAVAIIFQVRMHRRPTRESIDNSAALPWKRHLTSLHVISVLILIRSIFRVVEYTMGFDGYPLTHEWTLYIFDSVPMFSAMVIFAVYNPSDLQPFLVSSNHLPLQESSQESQYYSK